MAIRIRPATEADLPAALALAHRLEIGVAPWRDRDAVLAAVRGWVEASLKALDQSSHAAFVAEEDLGDKRDDQNRSPVGFITVEETKHWSGTREAYIGELVVEERSEGRGVGRALVEEAMAWARAKGYDRIGLETGAANDGARRFYQSLAFEEEDVRLSRQL